MKLSFHLLFIYTRGIRPLNFETIKIEILPEDSIGYRWEERDLRDSDDTVREQTRRRRRRRERCFRTCVRREEGDLHLFRGSPCRKYHSTTASYCAIKPGFASILHFREALHRAWNVRGETRLVSGKIVDKLGVNGSRVSVRESRENWPWRVVGEFWLDLLRWILIQENEPRFHSSLSPRIISFLDEWFQRRVGNWQNAIEASFFFELSSSNNCKILRVFN